MKMAAREPPRFNGRRKRRPPCAELPQPDDGLLHKSSFHLSIMLTMLFHFNMSIICVSLLLLLFIVAAISA